MSKPSKRDTLDFLHQVRGYYSTTGLGYKILDYLEDLVKKQGGKNNGTKEARHKKP